jgi:hypothetical protein
MSILRRFFRRRQRPRILALLPFRDEMRFLPGFFENVPPQVDGIIALDDCSSDGSAEFVARQPSVLELLKTPQSAPHEWNDSLNHRMLVEAAWKHRPDWLLGIDADERLERGFQDRGLLEIARAEREGHSVLALAFRELWDAPRTYRDDGVFGRKRKACLFRSRRDHLFDERRLHCHWAPLNDYPGGAFPPADLLIYHLRMIRPEDRLARQARYERLDPDRSLQPIGYEYLTDLEGLRLQPLPPGREYFPLEP